jgi:hypothetical protein
MDAAVIGDSLAATACINEMTASAIRVNLKWFWKNVRAQYAAHRRAGATSTSPFF